MQCTTKRHPFELVIFTFIILDCQKPTYIWRLSVALDDSKKNTIQYSFRLYSLKALVLHTTWPSNLFLQFIPKRSPTKGERPASNLDCNFASMWRRCNAIGRGGVLRVVGGDGIKYFFNAKYEIPGLWYHFYVSFQMSFPLHTLLHSFVRIAVVRLLLASVWIWVWLKVVEQRLVSNWHTYLSVVPKIWNQRL